MLTWSAPTFFLLEYPSDQCVYANDLSVLSPLPNDTCFLWADVSDPAAEAALQMLAEHLGARLLVPEVWREVLPQAGVVVSAAISGGFLEHRLQNAAEASPGRCWLLADPVRMRFPLPCPSGCGLTLSEQDILQLRSGKPSFYSPELCCQYCYQSPDSVLLFDTEQSLAEKLRLAEQMGFHGALVRTMLR